MKKLVTLIVIFSLAAFAFASHPVTANAAPVYVVTTINGGGTANMTDLVAAGFKGVSSFGINATLYSDGSASGHFNCVDHTGDAPGYPGNIFGDITSWSPNPDGTVNLNVSNGTLIHFPGGSVARGVVPFTVTIQRFGGAGVGHWTLTSGGVTFCIELLTSGQIRLSNPFP
jgi:hypothetical protein